jgi:hypothetical protein
MIGLVHPAISNGGEPSQFWSGPEKRLWSANAIEQQSVKRRFVVMLDEVTSNILGLATKE